jgi:hypothetical protein
VNGIDLETISQGDWLRALRIESPESMPSRPGACSENGRQSFADDRQRSFQAETYPKPVNRDQR